MDLLRIRDETWIREIDFHWEIASTNTHAMQLAESSDTTLPLLVLAKRQSQGRGRGSNQWLSSEGSLTFSVIVPIDHFEPRRLPQISLTAGIAICQAIEQVAPAADVGLKWPNDVYLGHAKVAGILIEMPGIRPARCVIGVGLNVNNPVDPSLETPAISMHEAFGQPFDLSDMLVQCLIRLERGLDMLSEASASMVSLWRSYDYLHGRRVEVNTYGKTHAGVARGIDDFGALLLETPHGITSCVGGIVTQKE